LKLFYCQIRLDIPSAVYIEINCVLHPWFFQGSPFRLPKEEVIYKKQVKKKIVIKVSI
jgi:hypothetical protein